MCCFADKTSAPGFSRNHGKTRANPLFDSRHHPSSARLLAGSAISDEAKELLHDAICSDGAPEPRGREPSPWGSGRILWT